MDLKDRVAVLTGARRIGAAVAEALAAAGADIVLAYRTSRAQATHVVSAVRAAGRRASTYQCDLRRPEDCAGLIAHAAATFGRVDILVNMASVYRSTPYGELEESSLDEGLAVDLRAAYLCARAAVPHMRAAGGGRIVNFSDWLADSGRPRYPGYLPYYVAKAAVVGLTEALALELAADKILVNAVAPGPILAPEGLSEHDHEAVERATPLGRWGGEAEVVKAVLFLITTEFVTGETIRLDGGRHLR
jgi:NAD(P)-dependent dehydrogenase (short-subunit alcohol dehydrogenase family)